MKKQHKFFWFLGVIVVIFFLLGLWVTLGPLTNSKQKILRILPVPIAFVGSEPIVFSSFLEAKKELPATISEQNVLDALLKNFRYKELANSLNLELLKETQNQSQNILSSLIGYKNALKLYYNSSQSLNAQTYSLAQNLKSRIESGEDFQSLSNIYNQDDFSKTFGGQTGEINSQELLPEILNQLKSYKPGQTVVVPSRLGIHIIKIVGQGNEKYNLEQIFLKTSGVEDWLNNQTSQIKIKTIIKI